MNSIKSYVHSQFATIKQNPEKAPQLPCLPAPGLSIIPGFVATKQEHLILKTTYNHWTRETISVSRAEGEDSTLPEPFLEIVEAQRKDILKSLGLKRDVRDWILKTTGEEGREVMRLRAEKHFLGTDIYRALDANDTEQWKVEVERHLLDHTDYQLTVHPTPTVPYAPDLRLQNRILGFEKGILWNERPVAVMTEGLRAKRTDHVHVAQGMDILLVVGMAFIRREKQKGDEDEDELFGAVPGLTGV
jgi:hypothetical protein